MALTKDPMTRWDKIKNVTWYFGINGIFAASLYFGFYDIIEGVSEGAQNLALFIGWMMGIMAVLIMLIFMAEDLPEKDEEKGLLSKAVAARDGSVIPLWFDLTFDIAVLLTFIWFGHYVLAMFYILSIFVGKHIRDTPKRLTLEALSEKP